MKLFEETAPDIEGIRYLKEKLGDCLRTETADGMETIISSVEEAKDCEFKICFDPTLALEGHSSNAMAMVDARFD